MLIMLRPQPTERHRSGTGYLGDHRVVVPDRNIRSEADHVDRGDAEEHAQIVQTNSPVPGSQRHEPPVLESSAGLAAGLLVAFLEAVSNCKLPEESIVCTFVSRRQSPALRAAVAADLRILNTPGFTQHGQRFLTRALGSGSAAEHECQLVHAVDVIQRGN